MSEIQAENRPGWRVGWDMAWKPTSLGVKLYATHSRLISCTLYLWHHLPLPQFPVIGIVLLERTRGVCVCLSFPPYLSLRAKKDQLSSLVTRKWVPELLAAFLQLSLSCSQLVRTLGSWSGSISAHSEVSQGEISSLMSPEPPGVQVLDVTGTMTIRVEKRAMIHILTPSVQLKWENHTHLLTASWWLCLIPAISVE